MNFIGSAIVLMSLLSLSTVAQAEYKLGETKRIYRQLKMTKTSFTEFQKFLDLFNLNYGLGYDFGWTDLGDRDTKVGGFDLSAVPNVVSWSVGNAKVVGEGELIRNNCTGTHSPNTSCTFEMAFVPKSTGQKTFQVTFEQTVTYLGTPNRTETYTDTWNFYGVGSHKPLATDACEDGSTINMLNRAATFQIPIVGTDLKLTYTNLFSRDYYPSDYLFVRPVEKWFGEDGLVFSNHHFYDRDTHRLFLGNGTVVQQNYYDLGIYGLIFVPSPDGSEIYRFDGNGLHVATLTPLLGAQKYFFEYDANNRLVKIGTPDIPSLVISRDVDGGITKITAPYGQETTVATADRNYISQVTSPSGAVYNLTKIDGSDLYLKIYYPNQSSAVFAYGPKGLLEKYYEMDSLGNINFSYDLSVDSKNNIVTRSSLGRETILAQNYSTVGSVTSRTSPAGQRVTIEESAEELAIKTKVMSYSVSRENDKRFGRGFKRPIYSQVTSGDGVNTSIHYEEMVDNFVSPFTYDYLASVVSFGGRTEFVEYDNLTMTKTFYSPEGRHVTVTYNYMEQPISIRLGLDSQFDITYVNGQITEISQDSTKNKLNYTYNSEGYLSSVINARSEVVSYLYNAAGNLTKILLPDLREIVFNYDSNGNRSRMTVPSGANHYFSFNGSKMLEYRPPLVSGVSKTTNFFYNKDQQLEKISKPGGKEILFNYGAASGLLNSIVSEEDAYLFNYSKSTPGRLESIESPYGFLSTFKYKSNWLSDDELKIASNGTRLGSVKKNIGAYNTVDSVTVTDGNGLSSGINYFYGFDGRPSQIDGMIFSYNAEIARPATSGIGIFRDYTAYDSYGRVSEYTSYLVYPSYTPLYSYNLTRDDMGRITSELEMIEGVASVYDYHYDSSGRLTSVDKDSVQIASFSYDLNGNRTLITINGTTTSYTYDEQDRLLSAGANTYEYSDSGDLTEINFSLGDEQTFSRDIFGNLNKVTWSPTGIERYEYDGLNRLVKRVYGVSLSDYFLYQDRNIAATLSPAGELLYRFIYSPYRVAPEFMKNSIGENFRIITDIRGSPRLVVNSATGAVIQRIDYDILGKIIYDSFPNFQPFGYMGGIVRRGIGVVNIAGRDYDPNTGRWITKDSAVLSGSQSNLYSYGFNDPVNFGIKADGNQIRGLSAFSGFGISLPATSNIYFNSALAGSSSGKDVDSAMLVSSSLKEILDVDRLVSFESMALGSTGVGFPNLGIKRFDVGDHRLMQANTASLGICNSPGFSSPRLNKYGGSILGNFGPAADLKNQPSIFGVTEN